MYSEFFLRLYVDLSKFSCHLFGNYYFENFRYELILKVYIYLIGVVMLDLERGFKAGLDERAELARSFFRKTGIYMELVTKAVVELFFDSTVKLKIGSRSESQGAVSDLVCRQKRRYASNLLELLVKNIFSKNPIIRNF